MKVIYKYDLKPKTNQLTMPRGALILCVQTQQGVPRLWALVDADAPDETRVIEVYSTGEPVIEDMGVSRNYVGTFQLEGGSLVFHVFEYTGV